MAVNLTVAKTLDGAAVSDTLAGAGTGVDIGSVVNNQFAPIIDKTANTGKQDIYVRHDGTVDPITSFAVHIQEFATGTGFTYGGAQTAAGDFADLVALGDASGSSKNNADGLSGGFWMEMDADVVDANRFNHATRPTLVKIFGDNGGAAGDGVDLPGAFPVAADAMVYDAAGETLPSAPVAGTIGLQSAPTVLGDNAHLQFRAYLPSAYPDGGILQFETVFSYSFTA